MAVFAYFNIVIQLGMMLPSPCAASSQAFSVNAFRWRIRDERPVARTTWPEMHRPRAIMRPRDKARHDVLFFSWLFCITRVPECWWGRSTKFYMTSYTGWLRSNPISIPLPFDISLLTENVSLLYTSADKWYPFHVPSLELCIPFNCAAF